MATDQQVFHSPDFMPFDGRRETLMTRKQEAWMRVCFFTHELKPYFYVSTHQSFQTIVGNESEIDRKGMKQIVVRMTESDKASVEWVRKRVNGMSHVHETMLNYLGMS
ncbi:hypothetical protein Bbelb_200640 [Branchiostoma belcheri]|nr:hypothetical protein Bbelb_200640 [Branchiostoma belcheri]